MKERIDDAKNDYQLISRKIERAEKEYYFLNNKEKQNKGEIDRMLVFNAIERFLTEKSIQKDHYFTNYLDKEEDLEDKIVELFTRKGYSFQDEPQQVFHSTSFYKRINFLYPEKNRFVITRQLTISNHKKRHQGLKLQRPDLLIYMNEEPLLLIELKNPNRAWTGCEQEAKQQAYRYLKTTGYVLKSVSLAVVTNGNSLEYSFPPFKKWKYIANTGQFFELITQRSCFLYLSLLSKTLTSTKFRQELLEFISKN